jgi:hypothetical protein
MGSRCVVSRTLLSERSGIMLPQWHVLFAGGVCGMQVLVLEPNALAAEMMANYLTGLGLSVG